MKKKIYSKNRKTREQLANRYSHLTTKEHRELFGKSDMKNYAIEGDLNGYCSLVPLNSSQEKDKKIK